MSVMANSTITDPVVRLFSERTDPRAVREASGDPPLQNSNTRERECPLPFSSVRPKREHQALRKPPKPDVRRLIIDNSSEQSGRFDDDRRSEVFLMGGAWRRANLTAGSLFRVQSWIFGHNVHAPGNWELLDWVGVGAPIWSCANATANCCSPCRG